MMSVPERPRPFLPFALPDIGEEDIAEVVDTLRSGWITTGPKAKRFEEEFAAFIGGDVQAVACNSATSGLHLALEAVGVQSGGQVLTTPYTFTATAEVVRYLGAEPVFADIDPLTFNIDPTAAAAVAQTCKRLQGIIPVHFAGQSCDMGRLTRLAEELCVPVIDDAAHALPATFEGRMIGSISTATVFSFYATKTVATGEGGMLVSRDARLMQRARTMRLHGIDRDVFSRYSSNAPKWYYEVVAPGFKYNMPDTAAALGLHQLRKAERMRLRRQHIAARYDSAFFGLPVRCPHRARHEDIHAWHLYVIQLDLGSLHIDRDRFIELMSEAGIGCSVHFIPLHVQPYWRDRYGFTPESFPIAWETFQRAVSLPIYSRMTDADIEYVAYTVRNVLERYSR
jgi:dTDP-4-amino-4,6-dideoxygalactose transaminase